MKRFGAILFQVVCVSLGSGAGIALAACPRLHDIQDMLASGVGTRAIENIFEETGWSVCLSEEDLQRLQGAGVSEDVLAFLRGRAQQTNAGVEEDIASAAAPNEEEEVPYPPPYPADRYYGFPYPYPYTYGGFGFPFLGGGGFHHHHFLGHHHHDWIGAHDPHQLGHHEEHHVASGGLGHLADHGAFLGAHAVGHVNAHGAHGFHGSHGAHGGHH